MKLQKKELLKVSTGTYTNNQGEQKNNYRTIGEINTFQDDKGQTFQGAEIYHMPGVRVKVFEANQQNQTNRQQQPQQPQQPPQQQPPQQSQSLPQDEIRTEDIPFN